MPEKGRRPILPRTRIDAQFDCILTKDGRISVPKATILKNGLRPGALLTVVITEFRQ